MHTPSKIALRAGSLLIMIIAAGCDSPYFNRNDPARLHRNKGIELFKKEKWSEAADEWKQSLQAEPEQKELYEKLAFAYSKAGKVDDAANTLLKTAEFKTEAKEKLDVTKKVAALYMQNQRLDKAEEFFNQILKADPKDDATLTWLGEIHSQLGGARSGLAPADLTHLDQAISYYDQALAINPEGQTPIVNRRIAFLKMQDYWNQKKIAADKAEAEVPKKDKKGKAEAHAKVEELQAKLDELKPKIEAATAQLSALLMKKKAAAAAGDGGTATPPPAADADGGTAGAPDAG